MDMATKIQTKEQECGVNYWLCVVGIIILMVCQECRDIGRPLSGLHSWADATGLWATRVHVNYGLKYTKGLTTWAVGEPPKDNPQRYYDHPQLGGFLSYLFCLVFGVHEWSLRLLTVLISIVTMWLFMLILKKLMDPLPALLAGLLYAIFPLTAYFYTGAWSTLFGFSAIYFYLVIINAFNDDNRPAFCHRAGLAASLFLGLQFNWVGFFYALAIGTHYVFRCVKRKEFPSVGLIAIMILAPAASMAVTFTIMAAGYGWDVQKIVELFTWRAGKGEYQEQMDAFNWSFWFSTLWKHASTNYTVPVLIGVILYFTVGQLFVFRGVKDVKTGKFPRQFPQFWLFFMVPFFALFILRGCLWQHQTWLFPLTPCIAIAASLGVFVVWDLIKTINAKVATTAVLVVLSVFTSFCIAGTNYYYAIRWQPEQKIQMFKMLNARIPADKYLLSFDAFIVDQHTAKGAFYRPEIAWYLDREIVQAMKLEEITEAAKTGKYPFYLMPMALGDPQLDKYLSELSKQLGQLYRYEYIPGVSGEVDKKGRFLKAGMPSYLLFDLQNPVK
jgi:4-amino-4-deoxy-L-arabinose transferase-like glycosyltransferase